MTLHCMVMMVLPSPLSPLLLLLPCSVSQQPYELSLLEKASLKRLDGSGAVVEGRELWHEKGAVIMVVRRPG